MIKNLLNVFGTHTKALEALYIMEGLKPVARLSVQEHELDAINSFCQKNSLSMETSDFRVAMLFQGAYSTAGQRLHLDSPHKGHFFVYLSRYERFAKDAKEAEADGNIPEFGRLLGYPDCCVKFFMHHRPDEIKAKNDYVIPAFMASDGYVFPFYNNIFGRYFDRVLLNHAPCSFGCRASAEIGRRNLKAVARHDPKLAHQTEALLKSAAIYTDNGIFLLPGSINENVFSYTHTYSTRQNILTRFLESNREIVVKDKSLFVVGGEEMNVPLLVFQ